MKRPYSQLKTFTSQQWQQARAMWRQGKDTHDTACVFGVAESHIYSGISFLKGKH